MTQPQTLFKWEYLEAEVTQSTHPWRLGGRVEASVCLCCECVLLGRGWLTCCGIIWGLTAHIWQQRLSRMTVGNWLPCSVCSTRAINPRRRKIAWKYVCVFTYIYARLCIEEGVQVPLAVFRPFICVESSIIIPKCCQLEALGSSHLNSMCVLKMQKEQESRSTLMKAHVLVLIPPWYSWAAGSGTVFVDRLINYTATTMPPKATELFYELLIIQWAGSGWWRGIISSTLIVNNSQINLQSIRRDLFGISLMSESINIKMVIITSFDCRVIIQFKVRALK